MANAQIVRDGLVRAIWVFISSDDRLDGQVIDEWIAVARYLVLKNKGHISLISLYHIGISHWDHREMMRTQRTVEGSEVLWIWMKQTLVVTFGPGRDERRLRGLSWFLVNTQDWSQCDCECLPRGSTCQKMVLREAMLVKTRSDEGYSLARLGATEGFKEDQPKGKSGLD